MAYYTYDKKYLHSNKDGISRVDLAEAYFKRGYNCAQAVSLAFADLFGLDNELMLRISASFGGGIGRMREVCGAVSGMCIVLGLFAGVDAELDYDKADSVSINKAKSENYRLVQEAVSMFKDKNNGMFICRDLLGLSDAAQKETHIAADRTSEYYKKRPCAELVRICAEITIAVLDKYQ